MYSICNSSIIEQEQEKVSSWTNYSHHHLVVLCDKKKTLDLKSFPFPFSLSLELWVLFVFVLPASIFLTSKDSTYFFFPGLSCSSSSSSPSTATTTTTTTTTPPSALRSSASIYISIYLVWTCLVVCCITTRCWVLGQQFLRLRRFQHHFLISPLFFSPYIHILQQFSLFLVYTYRTYNLTIIG